MPLDLGGGDTSSCPASSPAVVTPVAVLVDELPGAISPALTTTSWTTPLVDCEAPPQHGL